MESLQKLLIINLIDQITNVGLNYSRVIYSSFKKKSNDFGFSGLSKNGKNLNYNYSFT
jgi:hypothetical protein